MEKKYITVKDYNLFVDIAKAAAKVVESAKFIVGAGGLEIYGMRQSARARCELTSNAVSSQEDLSFSIENLSMFTRVLQTAKDIHEGDYSGMKLSFDGAFFRIESKKFKTKYSACDENIIAKWVSKKITAEFKPVFEFTSTSDLIKRLNSNAFMFSDPKSVRVYLETKREMENNAVFATLGNRETALNNEITLKFGLVTAGTTTVTDENGIVVDERRIVLDLERVNLFNAIQSNSIKIQLMDVNCLVSTSQVSGKDGAFFKLVIYSTILKN